MPHNDKKPVEGDEALGHRFELALKASRIRASELADKMGVTRSAVSGWMNGRVKHITASNLILAADIMGVSPAWLSGLVPSETPILKGDSEIHGKGTHSIPYFKDSTMASDPPPREVSRATIVKYALTDVPLLMAVAHQASIRGRIQPGDEVMIRLDRKELLTAPIDGAVIAIEHHGTVLFRRIRVDFSGGVVLENNNDDDEFVVTSPEKMKVLGQCVTMDGML